MITLMIINVLLLLLSDIKRTDKWNSPSLCLCLTHTHKHESVCEHEDDTVIWNQAVHTDREVKTNR